ncbi:uncharacterized protein QC761_108284 [Podospora bellae-mahoneyi]|uniref:Zn(2)-C6 fungal-type domain-containing protein n=1 Tax=Podospora bellae-mahoneyi TaxID=2093777 RepID=A0ABR0FW95_9PEZI|nr:hypothetical protein QC761_108284 [Podospora bellae-mahoneyi]
MPKMFRQCYEIWPGDAPAGAEVREAAQILVDMSASAWERDNAAECPPLLTKGPRAPERPQPEVLEQDEALDPDATDEENYDDVAGPSNHQPQPSSSKRGRAEQRAQRLQRDGVLQTGDARCETCKAYKSSSKPSPKSRKSGFECRILEGKSRACARCVAGRERCSLVGRKRHQEAEQLETSKRRKK